MPEMEAHPVLPKMIGETITIPSPNLPDSDLYPRRNWVVIEKLSEYPRPVTPKDFDDGMGPAYTAGKYLCRLADPRGHNKLSFMRIYKQIPLAGTELDNSSIRKAQASKPRDHVELHALKHFTKERCTATPKLPGYQIDKQDENDLVPGGYIIHLVWENARGYYPLDIEEFWSFPYSQRERIRKKFKMAYTEVLRLGYELSRTTASKIILNKTTDDVKVSGFRRADRIPPDTQWDDYNFVRFLLVLNSPARYKYLSIKAKDLKSEQNSRWKW
ncbi:uncharacterized protein N7479_009730 [Penicillium vulpinum]|uniref:Protein kinase domain-containing protein n=1 Tax=Penicillium vulpinum TaxID=29845 RepID=A0A1V6RXT6_9EURO|nr:uncharacterized protein N7479_009730 [Penicillium vulpinum]KAJ5951317.1 hypothetical protein N7479_009730 [Penicillium vulpinum]OQE06595.1 hypothetical protein PENVUL_c017G03840 [Penicillium vulpinum]